MNMVIKIKYNFQVRPNNEEENKQNTHTNNTNTRMKIIRSKQVQGRISEKKTEAQTYGKKKLWNEEREKKDKHNF